MATLEAMTAEKPPIQKDADGVYRVGGTRVRLETVVTAFRNGCTAEEILFKYPSLALPDIYLVIAYCLRHREEVGAYMAERGQAVREAEREAEARHPSAGVRERLTARGRAAGEAVVWQS